MKKIAFVFIIFLFFINLAPQNAGKPGSYVAFLDDPLVIAESDLLCSYFITKRISEDIRIIGSQEMDLDRVSYIDNDELFINKGSKDGYKEGDMFSILARGKKISNPFTRKKLGTYFLKKSLAEITCIFEDTAVITLRKCCAPVEITDLVLPYKKEDSLRKKKIDYRRCVLPRSPVEGNVVYTNLFMEINRESPGPESYITIDIGKAFVAKGDYVLFYKNFKGKLPSIIIGSGIVINPQNTNSTVRIIECSYSVDVGMRVVLMPETRDTVVKDTDDDVLIIDTFRDVDAELVEEKSLEINILFNLDEKAISPEQKNELESIKEFVGTTSKYRVILRGYTCSIGSLEYNLKLSRERVENIKNILMQEFGIPENVIETYYYGEKDASYDNSIEEQRRKNRAVNIQVVGK